MSWFRRRTLRPSALDHLLGEWTCASCGKSHRGLMDLAAFAPDPWPGYEERQPNSEIRLDGNFLSEDFCVMDGRYFFVRAVLEIPIDGLAEKFGFGCWSTLSRANFEKYLAGFDHSDYSDWGPWSGWLSNQLADYIGSDPEAVWVYPQPDRQRPTLRVQNDAHPLAIDQEHGISADRVMEILARYGHGPG